MKRNYFVSVKPNITDNAKLRIPQKEGYLKIQEHYSQSDNIRETGIVLPVGCGKSGLITLAPFALGSNRVLVIAPGLRIKKQLAEDFNVSSPMMFYQKCSVINGKLPTSSIIEGRNTNIHDLNDSDVVITNIQQIQGDENKWLMKLPRDFFDCIVVDEAHHNIASSWDRVREHFSEAKIINLSATPVRADGKVMAGKIIYTFSIVEAIKCGYVKQLKAKILSPATLKYIRSENGQEIEVAIDEIRRLGEEDSRFRRGIVSSPETLNTIIDCSIRELFDMRQRTGDNRHKIIASALNHEHCIQITEAYKARDLRAEYIHSQEDSVTNEKILEKLENNQLDVIVQVKMLGEGFDHPYLSIAAVCSIFSNLAPFAQFVGRIMRVIDQNSPTSPNNQGVVICHAGGNIARRWEDFRSFSKADQEFFDQFLLPIEELDFTDAEELEYTPGTTNGDASKIDIVEQEDVYIKELDLYKDNQEVQEALRVLKNNGLDVILKPIQVSPQKQRLASKRALDDHIKHLTGVLLQKKNVSHDGKTLDKSYIKTNFAFIKSLIDSKCNEFLGIKKRQRSEISLEQIQLVEKELDRIIEKIEAEAFNGTAYTALAMKMTILYRQK
jgi:superfamily II DNA or RNA helicase